MARGLAEIRREFLQPRLDELMAAEAKAAGMLAKLKDMDNPATQARMTAEMGQLQAMLRALNINASASSANNGATSNPRPTDSAANDTKEPARRLQPTPLGSPKSRRRGSIATDHQCPATKDPRCDSARSTNGRRRTRAADLSQTGRRILSNAFG